MMTLTQEPFGVLPDGTTPVLYTFKTPSGMTVKATNYGLIITELHVPDRGGTPGNVVLGFDSLDRYLKGHPFFGAIAGRVANRIARGRFTLDGQDYVLAVNNGPNHLHGGLRGFDKRLWAATPLAAADSEAAVEFRYLSADGEEGYPGNLEVTVRYTVTAAQEVRIDYQATTDRATLVNLTNHSYFNLAGRGDILGHVLRIEGDHYTPSDAELIPTGEIAPVAGTPFDFTQPRAIGDRHLETGLKTNGYDHNFVLRSGGKEMARAARVVDPGSGRTLEVSTTEPGVQLYTANFLDGSLTGVGGVVYGKHSGFCLETQHFPDSIHRPNFPTVVVRPGEVWRSRTVFKFGS